MDTERMDEKEWDDVADSFEEEIFNVPANDRKGLIKERIFRLGGKERVAADLGCGVGRTLPWLAGRFREVHAVDISRKCLSIAQGKCAAHDNIHYVHADLSKGSGLSAPVDLVVSINTLLNASLGKREAILEHTCAAVRKGGHLLLVVPSVESALLTSHKLVQWHRRSGLAPKVAERKAWRGESRTDLGVVIIDDVPTKHHLREEMEELLTLQGLRVEEMLKIEYPWSTEFEEPSRTMREPYPWDWLVMAQRRN